MANPQQRERIISDLRGEIRYKTSRAAAALFDVSNLVSTVLEYPGGMQELLYVVRFYEQDSLAWQELDRTTTRVLPESA
jgi:hypothetical protein